MTDNQRVRVVSDGTAKGTKVLDANGNAIEWGDAKLEGIEFEPIKAGCFWRAKLTVALVGVDIVANASVVERPRAVEAGSTADPQLAAHVEMRIQERANLGHLYKIRYTEDGPEACFTDGAATSIWRVVQDALSEAGYKISPTPARAAIL